MEAMIKAGPIASSSLFTRALTFYATVAEMHRQKDSRADRALSQR
jgi:hypothetical protein